MRKIIVIGASALTLSLGVVAASAEPFNPVSGYNGSAYGPNAPSDYPYYGAAPMREGRAAAVENSAPYGDGTGPGSVLEQFHEGGNAGAHGR